MYDPGQILAWLRPRVKGMRLSRLKTLAAIVSAAMCMTGVGVLALGRAMAGEVAAKHCIKRVWRFLRNSAVECESISHALFSCLAPKAGSIVVLVDWTEIEPYQQLVCALPRDGRALPFWSKTILRLCEEGEMVAAEEEALEALGRICPGNRTLVLIADRGFGNTRWLNSIAKRGWSYVQRLAGNRGIEIRGEICQLRHLPIPDRSHCLDWGPGRLTGAESVRARLVTARNEAAKETWILVTDLRSIPPEIVRLYQRRMWIEEAFRDLKNRNWGLGMDKVRLSSPERHDRLFTVLALAYALLCAFGAAAESLEVDRLLKANTVSERVLNLARLGNYFLQLHRCAINTAIAELNALPP